MAVMTSYYVTNPIRINQVGYLKHSEKKFVYEGGEADFSVDCLYDCKPHSCYHGRTVVRVDDGYSVGDFSDLTEEGMYRIVCEGNVSWAFVIYDEAYETVRRLLCNYFVWQRCGDPSGWAGECHIASTLVTKDGVVHKIHGGHHQSCDLRKWCEFSTVGTRRLCQTYLMGKPRWDRAGNLLYDIVHSAKYYNSLVSAQGYVYDCTFVHEGYDPARHGKGFGDVRVWWKPFQYYDSPAPAVGEWNTLLFLADAARALREEEPTLASECRRNAEKIWHWMKTEGIGLPVYDWIVPPPLGHDQFRETLFRYYYRDSAHTLCSEIASAAALYRLSEDETYYRSAEAALEKLLTLEVKNVEGEHLCFRAGPDEKIPCEAAGTLTDIPCHALADALEVWQERPIAEVLKRIGLSYVGRIEKLAKSNSFGKAGSVNTLDADGNPVGTLGCYCENLDLGSTVIALMQYAPFAGWERCMNLAQHLIDWMLGCNPCDSSTVEGVGRNQAPRAVTSEFFPPTPQIPGAVITELNGYHFTPSVLDAEYDLPIVGAFLYALSLYTGCRTKTENLPGKG